MKHNISITMMARPCELCNAEAAVFCPSDAAFLCRSCDATVHEANFLVARHLRHTVCSNCKTFTGEFVPGVGLRLSAAACPSCPPATDEDLDYLSSTSSACISSTTSPPSKFSGGRRSDSSSTVTSVKRRRKSSKSRVNNLKVEGIFVNWCGKLGIERDSTVGESVGALKVCVEKWRGLPFRVSLAASMCLGIRLSLEKPAPTLKQLKRLEAISGVPAKIILAVELKLKRAVRGELEHRRRLGLEEGWAEC